MNGGYVLDTAALVSITRGGSVYLAALLSVTARRDWAVVAPTGALAAAWTYARGSGSFRLLDLRQVEGYRSDVLDEDRAREIGLAAIWAGQDVDLAHIVWCARELDWPIVTTSGAADRIRAVARDVDIRELP